MENRGEFHIFEARAKVFRCNLDEYTSCKQDEETRVSAMPNWRNDEGNHDRHSLELTSWLIAVHKTQHNVVFKPIMNLNVPVVRQVWNVRCKCKIPYVHTLNCVVLRRAIFLKLITESSCDQTCLTQYKTWYVNPNATMNWPQKVKYLISEGVSCKFGFQHIPSVEANQR